MAQVIIEEEGHCLVRLENVYGAAVYKLPWWKALSCRWRLAIYMDDGSTIGHRYYTEREAKSALKRLSVKLNESMS